MLRPTTLRFLLFVAALSLQAIGFSATPESWMAKPPEEWPQMVLTNWTQFRGHTPLEGASAFLLRTPKGEIVGATALHLIGANGGVEPTIDPLRLNSVLERWELSPRTKPDDIIKVTGLGPITAPPKGVDWLLLKIDAANLPKSVQVLNVRARPVVVGETVYLVGVSYAEPKVAQKVYKGTVTQRAFGTRFRFDISPYVDIRGFSGAPILDKDGLVIGVTSIWFEPKKLGSLWKESGGEDTASLLGILK